ncbi:hypothetical protein [Marinobacter fuscus]|uniref:hypothetical protein n=1 Tax=Marinobacter fuscus TaxID=2109942 RepID=UPI00197D2C3F|nr:hypothetical protein [Marinobacter fuscus]
MMDSVAINATSAPMLGLAMLLVADMSPLMVSMHIGSTGLFILAVCLVLLVMGFFLNPSPCC